MLLLHIPFPHFEVFRLLPRRKEILKGLAGADLIGFHTQQYTDYFLHCVNQMLGYHVNGGIL
ncbi:MAG: trehalose-6-phosphate synthase [Phaeodactylibacter sp.]|nr:trehalose-6-phosphate synthase [Phaeodactylibacter sp.]